MALTGHYETSAISTEDEEELTIKLLAFRFVEGSHTGENLAGILFGILSEYNILHKVSQQKIFASSYMLNQAQIGSITLDNASNNDTMMEGLQKLMEEAGHTFHKDGNRIS